MIKKIDLNDYPWRKAMSDSKFLFNKRSKSFSIIELMVVVFIILLLMTLMIPFFTNLKMNARTSLCKGQLRQIGVLITSYQTDNDGYLPNDNRAWVDQNGFYHGGDIKLPQVGNNEFYRHWNGHLLPYLDVNLPEKYTRNASVNFVNGDCVTSPEITSSQDILKGGWAVVDDALIKGGYQDLKAFICPEIHANTFDVEASNKNQGARIPRIGLIRPPWGESGVPTTYLANEYYFGRGDTNNSLRVDRIANISEKAFLVEGGVGDSGWNGEVSPPYYMLNNYYGYSGGALTARFAKSETSIHKLSFVHDNYNEFWIKDDCFAGFGYGGGSELAVKFNSQFAGKAMMVPTGGYDWGCLFSLVSYVPPENGKIFEEFFKANNSSLSPLNAWDQFVDEPNDYKYLVGNMNILFGDNSVSIKDNGWLCNNRQRIAGALN